MITFEKERLSEILNGFTDKRILVIGDLMIDEYLWGNVTRLSPEAPVPVVEIENESLRFGGAANVALNIRTLGCQPLLIGIIGKDRPGNEFIRLMNESGMSADGLVQVEERVTTVKTRIIGDNQHLARVDREDTAYISGALEEKIIKTIAGLLPEADAVILEDYNKGLLSKRVIQSTIQLANEHGLISSVDPKFVHFLEYSGATVFKPNIKETSQALARVIDNDTDVDHAGAELLQRLKARYVLLTLGAKGLALFGAKDEKYRIPAKTRKVADVSGAGDTVISTMTAALVGGATALEAACLANYAAGIVCEEVGIVPIERQRLQKEIEEWER